MRFIIMVMIVLAVAGLGAIVFRPRIARAAMLAVGATAPDFHSQVVNGDQVTPVSLSDYRAQAGALLLSQGQYARMHQGGVRVPRRLRALSGRRYRGARMQY